MESAELTEKRRMLLQMLMQQRIEAANGPVIPQAVRTTSLLPTTLGQQGIWFLEMLAPASSLHSTPLLRRLVGKLDVEALTAAMNAVVARHEILRTTLIAPEGLPMQIVAPERVLTPHWIDLRDRDVQSREWVALRLAAEEARRPFDLINGPLLRMTLLKLDAEEHWLLLNVHHLVFDGWSTGVLFTELSALYAANHHGRAISLSALRIQYADYARRQQESLQSAAYQDQLEYWKRQLQGSPSGLALPTDRPRPAQQSFCGASHAFSLDARLVKDLLALSRREGITLSMAVLTAFAVLLQRYSQQDDLLIGTPVANRHPETEPLIGRFSNTLILRADLAGDPTLRELLGRIRTTCMGAYANQEIPFERIVETLRPKRAPGWLPFINIQFQLQTIVGAHREVTLPGLDIYRIPLLRTEVSGDLMLNLIHTLEGVHGAFEYRADLFEKETISRIEGHLQTLLRSILETPDLCISQLAFLTLSEAHQLRCAWNTTRSEFPTLAQCPLAEHDLQRDRVAPHNDLERRLLVLWENVLQVRPMGVTDNFFDLGGRSLLAIRLLQEVNRRCGTVLSLAEMLKAPTVREMAELLNHKQQGTSQWSPLVPLQPHGDLPPLFCAPVGGGSAFYYRALATHIGGDRPLYTLEPRGMSGELPPHQTVEEMATYYIEVARTVQSQGPYYLCGLSFGGTVAFEMARQLEQAGEQVGLLLLFDSWAPGVSGMAPPAGVNGIMRNIVYSFRLHREYLALCRSTAEKRKYLQERLSRLLHRLRLILMGRQWHREMDNPVFRELPEVYQAVAAAEKVASEVYQPGIYTGKIYFLQARVHPNREATQGAMGWDRFVTQNVEATVTPGTHHSLLEEPCVHVTVTHIRRILAEAQKKAYACL